MARFSHLLASAMRNTRFVLGLAASALSLAAVAGCSGSDDYLTVYGSATVTTSTAETGFPFATETRLDEDRAAIADGRVVGHCSIVRTSSGVPTLDVALSRPGFDAMGGLAMRSYTIHVDDTRVPASGTVTAELGDVTYSASSGASCTIEVSYLDVQQGIARVTAACSLAGSDGTNASTRADLEWSGCTVQ